MACCDAAAPVERDGSISAEGMGWSAPYAGAAAGAGGGGAAGAWAVAWRWPGAADPPTGGIRAAGLVRRASCCGGTRAASAA